jgi:hypothetical protein
MDYNKFVDECIGVTIDGWATPTVLIGMYSSESDLDGKLSTIPKENPLSKQLNSVDNDTYFRFADVKLLRHYKYVEQQQSKPDENERFRPGKSAIG